METTMKMLFQENNLPERYIPLEHTHRYIVEKSKQYSLHQVAEAMGWIKLQKLRWRRQKWDNLQQHIPKSTDEAGAICLTREALKAYGTMGVRR